MKIIRAAAAATILALMLALASLNGVAAVTEHCPAGGAKVEAVGSNLNDVVPAAGTQVCVKGSTEATGIVTADGQSTLYELLGNGHDVSYYVTYGGPTSAPTDTPTSTPTAEPSATPTGTPTPSASPSDSPGSSASPSAPTSTPTAPSPTQPSTDTQGDVPVNLTGPVGRSWFALLIGFIVLVWLVANWGTGRAPKR
jgi:hypothetical protein